MPQGALKSSEFIKSSTFFILALNCFGVSHSLVAGVLTCPCRHGARLQSIYIHNK